jgi:hypothetical protein
MQHKGGRGGINIGYWWENQRERDLGRPRCRWMNNIRMDLGEIGWSGVEWIDLAKDRNNWRALVNGALNLWFP